MKKKKLITKSQTVVMQPETIIKKYGYEYHLVGCDRIDPIPCFLGKKGFVLKSCNKIK
jgi:hypothetical protein